MTKRIPDFIPARTCPNDLVRRATELVLSGGLFGVGIVIVVAAAFAIADAGDIFTVDRDGVAKFVVSDAGKITVGATESYVNLAIQNNTAVAGNELHIVNITSDVLTVEGIRLENVSVSADIAVNGAGGLDAGSEAANTWYYVWVIVNNNGSSPNGLLSTSSTTPTLPSGFTKKRRIGAVRNNGSSNFLTFVQEGPKVLYTDAIGIAQNRILTSGTSTTFTSVLATPLSTYLPLTSRRGILYGQVLVTHNAANVTFTSRIRKAGSSANVGSMAVGAISQVANVQFYQTGLGEVDVDDNQQIEWMITTVPSTSGGLNIEVVGYYDRI